MTADPETLAAYDARAQDYAEAFGKDHSADPSLRAFAEALPVGALVLDFGCGPGSWARAMIALGYAGWGEGQLEDELQRNGWLTCDADEDIVFERANDDKWTAALAKLGVDPRMLSAEGGSA